MSALNNYQLQETIQIDYKVRSINISEHTCLYEIHLNYSPNVELIQTPANLRLKRCGIALQKDFNTFLKTRNLAVLPVHEYAVLQYNSQDKATQVKAEKDFFSSPYFERYPKTSEGRESQPLEFDNFIQPNGQPNTEELEHIRLGVFLNSDEVFDYQLQPVGAPIHFDAIYGNYCDQQYNFDIIRSLIEQNPQVANLQLVRGPEGEEEDSSSPQYLIFDYFATAEQFKLMSKIISHFKTDEVASDFLMMKPYQRIAKSLNWVADIPANGIHSSYIFNAYESNLSNKIKELAQIFEEQNKLAQNIKDSSFKSGSVLKI